MIEKLEDRQLLSVTASEPSTGHVIVTSNWHNDTVDIDITAAGNVTVRETDVTPNPTWTFTNINLVTVNLGIGMDFCDVNLAAANLTTGVHINGGPNGDTIDTFGPRIKIDGEEGPDTINMNGNLFGEALGGSEDDTITAFGNSPGVSSHGGKGYDTIDYTGITSISIGLDEFKPYAGTGEKEKEYDADYAGGGVIHGSDFDDLLQGSMGVDVIDGHDGDDVISVNGAVDDVLYVDVVNGGDHDEGDWVWFDTNDTVDDTEYRNGYYDPD